MLNNVNIKTRLITVFASLFLFIVAVIVYAIIQMSTLGTITDKIANDRIPKIMALSEISKQVNLIARAARNMYIFKDKFMISEEKDTILKSRELIGEKLNYLKPIIKNPKAILILEEVFVTRAEFIKAQDKFIASIEREDLETAYTILLKEFRPIQLKYIASLDALLEFQSQSSQKEANDAIGFISTVSSNIGIVSTVFAILLILLGISIISSIVKPIHSLEKAVVEIGQEGNFDVKIDIDSNDEMGGFAKNFQTMMKNLNDMLGDATMLSQAAVDGKLSTRADVNKYKGDMRKIVEGVNKTLDAVIGPLNVAADYVDKISRGAIPPKITDNYNGDFNVIKNNLNNAIDNVNALVADANMLSRAAVEGKLATRADATKHQGDYRKIVEGVNQTLDAVIGPLNVAADYVDKISRGAIPPKITDSYNGDFNVIKINLNNAIENVNALVADAGMLSRAAVEGKLATRADATKHQGDYRKIVEGVNATLDSVIGPLNVAADYVDRISRGAIPAKITDSYNGDFNTIKNNLNRCIENVNLLVADAGMLAKAAIDGKLATRADATKHEGDFRKIVEGVNNTLDAVILPIQEAANVLQDLAKGNLKSRVTGDYKGDHANIKNALNSSLVSLNEYVSEISKVLSSMSAGDLTIEITKDFTGDFAEIKKALTLIVDSFNELIGEIIDASEQILISSRQVADSSQSLSQGSNQQASSVEEITSTLASIELKAKDNAKNAKDASSQAMKVKDQAVASNDEMKGMLKAMEEISDTSENIAKIIKEIDAIAFQTNILALNAAVEAARAGQHGKGFNVVAEEVRNLASRSANAAKETTKMIEGSIKTVRSGMDIASRTATELNKMTSGVVDVTELVKDIASASIEQSSSVVETTAGINQISQVTMSAAATAEESSAASLELSSQAEAFQSMVKRFTIKKSKESKHVNLSTKKKIDLK